MGILVLFVFSRNRKSRTIYDKFEQTDINSYVNLLCSNAFLVGATVHRGTFVYDNNDLTGQSIRGLFGKTSEFVN